MKHKFTFLASLLAAIGLLGVSSPVEAGITVTAGTFVSNLASSGSQKNEFKPNLDPLFGGQASVWSNNTIVLSGSGQLKFTYYGSESGYSSRFTAETDVNSAETLTENVNGTEAWGTKAATDFIDLGYGGGSFSLSFSSSTSNPFTTLSFGPFGLNSKEFGIFRNASSTGIGTTDGFVSQVGNTYTIWLGYDDGGGTKDVTNKPDDDNHDDMIIRMDFTPDDLGNTDPVVPEPATLAIWGLGLGIAGLVKFRRRQTAA